MKLLFFLFVITVLAFGTYYLIYAVTNKKKGKKNKVPAVAASIAVFILLVGLLASAIYQGSRAPDMQCGKTHVSTSQPPSMLKTATDYYEQGNYDYETGNCVKAISDYNQSIQLDSKYPQAYNNRAYTYMRLRNYAAALTDLDKALELKPDYIHALMNRGDIHNYYYQIDRPSAVKDYEKAKLLGANQKETSVCGHLLLAKHNGWTLGAFLEFPQMLLTNQCN